MRPIRILKGSHDEAKKAEKEKKKEKQKNEGGIDNIKVVAADTLPQNVIRTKELEMIRARVAREKSQREAVLKSGHEERTKLKKRVMSASEKIIKPKYEPRRHQDVEVSKELREKQLEKQKKFSKEWRAKHQKAPVPPANPPPKPQVNIVTIEPKKKPQTTEMNFLTGLDQPSVEKPPGQEDSKSSTSSDKGKEHITRRAFKTGIPRPPHRLGTNVRIRTAETLSKPAAKITTKQTSIWDYDLAQLEKRDFSRGPSKKDPKRRTSSRDGEGSNFNLDMALN